MSNEVTINFTIKNHDISEHTMIGFSSLVGWYVNNKKTIALDACIRFLDDCGFDKPYRLYDLCRSTVDDVTYEIPGFITRREMVRFLIQYIDESFTRLTSRDLSEEDTREEYEYIRVWLDIAKVFGGIF